MMIKKSLFLIFLASIVSAQQAPQTPQTQQEILNVFGSIGVGFKTGGQLFTSITQNSSGAITKEEDEFFNYGQGFKIDFGAQYLAMDNLGLQTDMEISLGAPGFETNNHLVDTLTATSLDSSVKYNRNLFGIKFMVVPRFEVLELITMYTGVGIGFFWNSLHYETTVMRPAGTTSEKGKIITNPTLGFTGLIGANYPISDIFALFGEIAFDQISFRWKKQVVDETNIAGHNTGVIPFEEDDPNPNNGTQLRVPGSNWQIRIGARLSVL
jgi:opacity protein-like surface antigen